MGPQSQASLHRPSWWGGAQRRLEPWAGLALEFAAILRDAAARLLRMRYGVNVQFACACVSVLLFSVRMAKHTVPHGEERAAWRASRTMGGPGSERTAILRDARKSALLRMRDRVQARPPYHCFRHSHCAFRRTARPLATQQRNRDWRAL